MVLHRPAVGDAMVCSRCGKPLPPGNSLCPTCHAPGIAPLKTPGAWVPPAARAAAAHGRAAAVAAGPETGHAWYAGFWIRVVAYAIDAVVSGIAATVVGAVVGGPLGFLAAAGAPLGAVVAPVVLVATIATYWLYFAVMESSARQATVGKMALGLAVTDDAGGRIGFGRATGRYLGKLLSAVVLGIGFLMAGLTERKQALHDLVAGTVVVRRRQGGTGLVVAIVAAVVAGTVLAGIAAAIAIPNFVRYQLRARSSEALVQLPALARAERAHAKDVGGFVPLALPAGAAPGRAKLQWSAEDLAAARALGWAVEDATWFAYAVAVGAAEDGTEGISLCAESDLDGDGTFAVVALWSPPTDGAGAAKARPPAAPCAHAIQLHREAAFREGDPIGVPVRLSPADVF